MIAELLNDQIKLIKLYDIGIIDNKKDPLLFNSSDQDDVEYIVKKLIIRRNSFLDEGNIEYATLF